jgi:hypothetical protein
MNRNIEIPVPEAVEAAAQVSELNQAYINAARTNDEKWFDRHMAETVLVILGDGRRMRKSHFLERMRTEPGRFRSLTVRDVTTRVFGTVVQVDADAPWELINGSRGVSRYLDTYAWLDGRWQVISAQITLLPPDPTPTSPVEGRRRDE